MPRKKNQNVGKIEKQKELKNQIKLYANINVT